MPKSILIFILLICLYIPNVKASYEITTDDIDKIKNNINQNGIIATGNTSWDDTDVKNHLLSFASSTIANTINNKINELNSNLDYAKNNITFIVKQYAQTAFSIYCIISNTSINNSNTLSRLNINANSQPNYTLNFDGNNYILIRLYSFVGNPNLLANNTETSITFSVDSTEILTSNSNEFEFKPIVSLQENSYYSIAENGNSNIKKNTEYLNSNIVIEQGTETENQYEFFRDSNNNEVNLLFNGNEYIGCIFYVGDNLTSTYNFYYLSGDEKISVNNYISQNTWRNSGDTGTYTSHAILNNNFSNFINNTQYYLDWNVSLNGDTINVLNGLEAFHTVEREIVTPTPTPTPTPEPNIATISGQINDINNNIRGSTQTIVNQISGDTEKITDAITNKITEEELENILPLSGDYVTQMGYKPKISPYNGFIINIYNIIKEALLGNGNVNLYVEFNGYSEYISSDRYYIPNNPFKLWLSAGMIALICWQIAKFGDQITQKLEKADINVMHFADADMYFF